MPLTVLPAFGGDGWNNVFERLECAFGTSDVCPMQPTSVSCDERLERFGFSGLLRRELYL